MDKDCDDNYMTFEYVI